jgi:hypothetical protein
MIEASAIVSAGVGRGMTMADELLKKGSRLLPVDDAGKGRILPQQTNASVPHHHHQEARLTRREAELGDSADPVFGGHKTLLCRQGLMVDR